MEKFEKQKADLLERCQRLLGFVKKKDLGYGNGTMQDTLEEEHLKELHEWYNDAEEFVERYGLNCQNERFRDSSWIINGSRVSVVRINELLKIVEKIEIE